MAFSRQMRPSRGVMSGFNLAMIRFVDPDDLEEAVRPQSRHSAGL